MKINRVIAIVLITFCTNIVHGQYYSLFDSEKINVEIEFLRPNIEANSGQTVFNVIKIRNRNQSQQTYSLSITYPDGWSLIGEDKFDISIPPEDSLLVPVRIAIGPMARGDIGYSIIAAINDSKGQVIKNEYSFIKVQKRTDTRIKILSRIRYIDQRTRGGDLNIQVENRGNKEELVSFLFEGERGVQVNGTKLSSLTNDYTISPYSDTIIKLALFFPEDDMGSRNLYRFKVTARTIDTLYRATAWFNDMGSSFDNHISESQKMLIAELISRGAFSNQTQPTFAGIIKGNILLKSNRDVSYYYENTDFYDSNQLYSQNRMWAAYKQKNVFIRVGDVFKSLEASTQGRGIESDLVFNNISLTTIATKNIRTDIINAGTVASYNVNGSLNIFTGAVYSYGTQYSVSSPLAILGSKFSIKRKHNFIVKSLYNPISFTSPLSDEKYHYNAYGGELHYNSRVANNLIRLRARFGSDFLNTSYGGRTQITLNSTQWFKNRSNLIFRFNYTDYQPYTYRDNPEVIKPYNINLNSEVHYGKFVAPKVFIYGGPGIELPKTDVFRSLETGTDYFSTRVGKLSIGSRMLGLVPNQTINLQVIFGYVNFDKAPALSNHSGPVSPTKEPFTYQHISGSIRNRNWSVQATYTNGPRSIFDHFSWNYFSKQSRSLRLMPTFNSFIFKDIIQLESSISYNNDLITRSSYTNFTNQLYFYLPNNWQIRGLNVYSMQSRVTPTEAVEKYSNLYFEFSVRKEFGFQQPRQKYYDLDLVFFKDFNGDGKQDPNEPGIQNVYVSIQKVDNTTSDFSSFVSAELLSDNRGMVNYSDLPAGVYEIVYYAVDKNSGNFTKSLEDVTLNLEKNTIKHFPFVEKNKVFGRIILNRSRLSGLGRIDLSNIRLTATDSHGRSFSTLTDKDGHFELFAPVTDEYIVNINNVFYENFDLRQNNFLVQFNGYKQFEVNFVFDEKVRRINFAATDAKTQTGVQQVRRTTISGTVKDANTQQPVRARVNLINTRTNAIATSAKSSATSGEYTISFIAGDNYLLEVVADDYWYLSENLVLEQITTFMNIGRDVLLKPVTVGSSINLNIRFDINSSFLVPKSVAELNRLTRQLKENPTVRIEIQGHCDNLEELNQPGIALERASVVGKYLVENGFSNFEIKSLGNTDPLSTDETEEGRAQNRRISIVVVSR